MATNPPSVDGHRNGAVRGRGRVRNPRTKQWVKRDNNTGRFMDVNKNGKPFKGGGQRNRYISASDTHIKRDLSFSECLVIS